MSIEQQINQRVEELRAYVRKMDPPDKSRKIAVLAYWALGVIDGESRVAEMGCITDAEAMQRVRVIVAAERLVRDEIYGGGL